jgi:hypothetical protein
MEHLSFRDILRMPGLGMHHTQRNAKTIEDRSHTYIECSIASKVNFRVGRKAQREMLRLDNGGSSTRVLLVGVPE